MADNTLALVDGALNVAKELIPDDRIYNLVKDFSVVPSVFNPGREILQKESRIPKFDEGLDLMRPKQVWEVVRPPTLEEA